MKTAEQKVVEDIAVAEKILTRTFEDKIHLEVGEKEGLSERTYGWIMPCGIPMPRSQKKP